MFSTDAGVEAMIPRTRRLHDAQVSLHRQQQQLDERYQRDSEKLAQAVEEDLVNRFRSSLRVAPDTAGEEAKRGGASSSTATTMGGGYNAPCCYSTANKDASSLSLGGRGDGRARIDARGDYPPPPVPNDAIERGGSPRRCPSMWATSALMSRAEPI